MGLYSTETFLSNVLRVVSTRRKELVLEVNFDPDKVELFKEVSPYSEIYLFVCFIVYHILPPRA